MRRRNFFITFCLLFFFYWVDAQKIEDYYNNEVEIKVSTTGKMVKPNALIMIVEVEIPEGWKLKSGEGFESMWEDGVDTVDIALKFKQKSEYRLVQRLKADRKPTSKGFYYEKVTFVQTIVIDTTKLPINIDAQLKWSALRMDEKQSAQGLPCCLLQVTKERRNNKTLKVGWNCDRRDKVYISDIQ